MTNFADLEMSFHKREAEQYSVELRLMMPDSEADTRPGSGAPISVQFNLKELQAYSFDPAEYGRQLAASLFVEEMKTAWAEVRSSVEAVEIPLRIRIRAAASAPEINAICWETLCDPQDNTPLFTSERFLPARYLSSSDLRPVKLRPKGSLKALVAASNPSNLAGYKLAEVNAAEEIERAKTALGNIPAVEVGLSAPCTLNALIDQLREGVDILYLAAHGTFANNEPRIWLQAADGTAAITPAEEFITRIKELQQLPRLVVLASCQSAGDGKFPPNAQAGRVLQALGPRLAIAGIPAVIAMQGNISMESVKKFLPVFFSELEKDGQIDRALAVARGQIRAAPDFWMPVLFMRLRSGRIWYVPGISEDGETFDKWPGLLTILKAAAVASAPSLKPETNPPPTPILGPGLYEPILGSLNELAEALAREYNYPLAAYTSSSLPQVNQFIRSSYDPATLSLALEFFMRQAAQQRFSADLPEELKTPDAPLLPLISACGAKARAREAAEQHRVLARLPLRLYITTNYDSLMEEALTEAGKAPVSLVCPWREVPGLPSFDPTYLPSKEKPLVYHLFGHYDYPETLVLTEDDYFEFLMGFTAGKFRNPAIIPPAVLKALTASPLMILGFHLDDWAFRAMFRTLMAQQGNAMLSRFSHVGIQLEMDEIRNLNPKQARNYLQKYFGESKISLYWGKSEDFLRQLAQKLPA